MSVGFNKIWESKRKIRQELRALPFVDKLRILERLRDDLLIGLAQQRKEASERLSKRPLK